MNIMNIWANDIYPRQYSLAKWVSFISTNASCSKIYDRFIMSITIYKANKTLSTNLIIENEPKFHYL